MLGRYRNVLSPVRVRYSTNIKHVTLSLSFCLSVCLSVSLSLSLSLSLSVFARACVYVRASF